jgi:hypothetical protein
VHVSYALHSYRAGPHINFRTLDLNLLRVFDRVMADGSLTRAAAELSMTQPAASHALKRCMSPWASRCSCAPRSA